MACSSSAPLIDMIASKKSKLGSFEGDIARSSPLNGASASVNTIDMLQQQNQSDASCRKHLEIPAEEFAEGCKLLQQAALGNLEYIQRMVMEKFNGDRHFLVTFRDYDRRTALHVAAAEGHLDICKFLVENGAHINRSDRWGASPLDDAYPS